MEDETRSLSFVNLDHPLGLAATLTNTLLSIQCTDRSSSPLFCNFLSSFRSEESSGFHSNESHSSLISLFHEMPSGVQCFHNEKHDPI